MSWVEKGGGGHVRGKATGKKKQGVCGGEKH